MRSLIVCFFWLSHVPPARTPRSNQREISRLQREPFSTALKAVAALKGTLGACRTANRWRSPRPSGRGRIEGHAQASTSAPLAWFSTAFGPWPH